MGPGALALASDPESAAIDLDHRQRRSGRDPRLQCTGPELAHVLISGGLQLLADLLGDAAQLPLADRHLGQVGHRLGPLAEGGLAGGTADDLAQDRGAVVMGRQPQTRPLREKNPGGKPGSDTGVRRR